jgi:hypothetical protein
VKIREQTSKLVNTLKPKDRPSAKKPGRWALDGLRTTCTRNLGEGENGISNGTIFLFDFL